MHLSSGLLGLVDCLAIIRVSKQQIQHVLKSRLDPEGGLRLTSNAKGGKEASGHECPVAGAKPLAVRVKRQVGVGALGVVVGRRETGAGSMESTAGDQRGRGASGGAGEHLLFS